MIVAHSIHVMYSDISDLLNVSTTALNTLSFPSRLFVKQGVSTAHTFENCTEHFRMESEFVDVPSRIQKNRCAKLTVLLMRRPTKNKLKTRPGCTCPANDSGL
jgi:hypothetical protein